jgi:hypothetical protein
VIMQKRAWRQKTDRNNFCHDRRSQVSDSLAQFGFCHNVKADARVRHC